MELTHKNYKILVDEYQYILQKRRTRTRKSDGVKYEEYEDIGYFSNIESLLNRMARIETLEKDNGDTKTIDEYVKLFRGVMNDFKREIVEPLDC